MDETELDQAEAASAALISAGLAEISSKLQPKAGNGICVDCKDPIPEARRKAAPSAIRCAECQSDYES